MYVHDHVLVPNVDDQCVLQTMEHIFTFGDHQSEDLFMDYLSSNHLKKGLRAISTRWLIRNLHALLQDYNRIAC